MDEDRPKLELYKTLFPAYADEFICSYFMYNNSKSVLLNENKVSFISYLEYDFEVNLDNLKNLKIIMESSIFQQEIILLEV